MSRTTTLVLVAIGATIAGFALSTNARRLQGDEASRPEPSAATPQQAYLGWRETYGSAREQFVFSVEQLEILQDGWRAEVALENSTSVPYELTSATSTANRQFGLMLFSSGETAELEELNASNTLPAVRPATRFQPELPAILEPGNTWAGTISAPGPLVAGSWVRVTFGQLVSVGPSPKGLADPVVWITDNTYQLRGSRPEPSDDAGVEDT